MKNVKGSAPLIKNEAIEDQDSTNQKTKNLGIVIGVGQYENISDLPGCDNDAKAVKALLELSKKCDEILFINGEINSNRVKTDLANFVEKHKTQKIDEVIFYFTGHGQFESNEFYYILSDYSENKKRQTSLENSELDQHLRNLGAQVTIKIVDACQSGSSYIKSSEELNNHLVNSKESFKICYFYFSSKNDQSSYQSENISDFTKHFIKSFLDRATQEIRYKDICDSLSDAFSDNTKQKPLFIIQGEFNEKFGTISKETAEALSAMIDDAPSPQKYQDTRKELIDIIKEDSKRFCTKEEVYNQINDTFSEIETFKLDDEINSLFDIETQKNPEGKPEIDESFIGNFFNSTTHNFFVELEKEIRQKKVKRQNRNSTTLSAIMMAAYPYDHDIYHYELEDYEEITGAKTTAAIPVNNAFIKIKSKYPNLEDTGCLIYFFVSLSKICIISTFFRYRSKNWESKEIIQNRLDWRAMETDIKNKEGIKTEIEDIFENLNQFVKGPIQKAFQKTE
ncbi:MAG: caspase family protein [Pseudomonadales bacterium]|nr:caspase family protein [Pseudomonadales bacterium]